MDSHLYRMAPIIEWHQLLAYIEWHQLLPIIKWERILNKIECYINSSFLWKYEKYMEYGNLSIFDNILKKQ